jgi:hypothetical protein
MVEHLEIESEGILCKLKFDFEFRMESGTQNRLKVRRYCNVDRIRNLSWLFVRRGLVEFDMMETRSRSGGPFDWALLWVRLVGFDVMEMRSFLELVVSL